MVHANNPRVTSMTARMPYPYSLADAEAWIASVAAEGDDLGQRSFGVYLKAGECKFIGSCGLQRQGSDPLPHLGYWIGEPHWGRGFASEAAGAVLTHAFADRRLLALQAGCRPDNPASRAVLKRLGFRHLGTALIYAAARRCQETIDKFILTGDTWRHDNPKAGAPS